MVTVNVADNMENTNVFFSTPQFTLCCCKFFLTFVSVPCLLPL